MNGITAWLWAWIWDGAVVTTIVLALGCIVMACVRTPARRVVVGRTILLVALATIVGCGLRSWGGRTAQACAQHPAADGVPRCLCAPSAVVPTGWQDSCARSTLGLAAGGGVWLVLGWWLTRRMLEQARPASARVEALAREVLDHDLRSASIWVSDRIARPLAVGAVTPRIVLPAVFAEGEDEEGVRLALAHEWGHIANGDLKFLALARVLEPLLLLHPLYWWVRRRVCRDQELLADARACAVVDPCTYAERLVRWARSSAGPRDPVFAGSLALWGSGSGSLLRERVSRLLEGSHPATATCPGVWRWGVRVAAIVVWGALFLGGERRLPAAVGGVGDAAPMDAFAGPNVSRMGCEQGPIEPVLAPSAWLCPVEVSGR